MTAEQGRSSGDAAAAAGCDECCAAAAWRFFADVTAAAAQRSACPIIAADESIVMLTAHHPHTQTGSIYLCALPSFRIDATKHESGVVTARRAGASWLASLDRLVECVRVE